MTCLLPLVASGCGPGPGTAPICTGWVPIRPTQTEIEAMSQETVDQIFAGPYPAQGGQPQPAAATPASAPSPTGGN